MSETTNQEPVKQFSITSGDRSIVISAHTVKKGQSVGSIYFAPGELHSVKDPADIVSLFPQEAFVENLLIPAVNRFCLSISKEAQADVFGTDKDGNLNPIDDAKWDEYVAKWQEFFTKVSARGESLKALTERKNEYVTELLKLVSNPQATPEYVESLKAVGEKIARIDSAIAEKKDKSSEEDKQPEPAKAA